MSDEYKDIIDLPFKKSDKYPHMSARDRAAQFAPFSALTGYSDTVNEVGRITDIERSLDEYEIAEIDREIQFIFENIKNNPKVTVTYFVPDETKDGGSYRTIDSAVVLVDEYKKEMELSSGDRISFERIISLKVKSV